MQATFAYLMKEISDESNTGEYPSITPLQWRLIAKWNRTIALYFYKAYVVQTYR